MPSIYIYNRQKYSEKYTFQCTTCSSFYYFWFCLAVFNSFGSYLLEITVAWQPYPFLIHIIQFTSLTFCHACCFKWLYAMTASLIDIMHTWTPVRLVHDMPQVWNKQQQLYRLLSANNAKNSTGKTVQMKSDQMEVSGQTRVTEADWMGCCQKRYEKSWPIWGDIKGTNGDWEPITKPADSSSVISINGNWNRNWNNLLPFREIGMRSRNYFENGNRIETVIVIWKGN